MSNKPKNKGFSLAEVLLAIGVLAVGVVFVAGVFPVCVHLTTLVAEQTIASIAADEAFAKVKLYAKDNPVGGIDLSKLATNQLKDFNDVLEAGVKIDPNEFVYPSTDMLQRQYYWTALCREVDTNSPRLVQVTVFVCRKASPNPNGPIDYPKPVEIGVSKVAGRDNELTINNPTTDKTFINDGYTIVDNKTGRIYRVLERYAAPDDGKVLLDRDWEGISSPGENVWVVPPPVSGGRGPCVGVYQKVIRF
jgi:prepilin-type N-terminal cleavage/methylation domain-containing protein